MNKKDMELISFLRAGGQVIRYHTQRRIRTETTGQHSFGVLWLAYYLADRSPSRNLLLACAAHDMAEHKVGDMPSPAKKDMGSIFCDEFDSREEKLLAAQGLTWELSDEEKIILKTSDLLDGMLSCLDERIMGNAFATEAFENYSNYTEDFIHSDKFPPAIHDRACGLRMAIVDNFIAAQGGTTKVMKAGTMEDLIESITGEKQERHLDS